VFSIIMPAYNVEAYIASAIDSVLAQTINDWELIITDDGSTDQSASIAAAYAARDARIRLIQHPKNRGLKHAYQTALDNARYDWVAVLDSDDIAFPNRLEIYRQAILEQPDVIAWAGYAHYINDAERLLFITDMGPKSRQEFEEMRARSHPIMMLHSTFVFRREIANAIGGYQDSLVPDMDLMDRLSDQGMMLTLKEPLAYYRIHGNSITHTQFIQQAYDLRYLWERRAAQNQGITLTREAFEEAHQQRSVSAKLRERAIDYGRMYWRQAGIAYGEKRYTALLGNAAVSFLLNPSFLINKVARQVKLRVLRAS
jgi:glycosyltransferase involved in cell wall biosynthesis